MPLWKLQRVGADRLDFLYAEELVDEGIVLRPGIAECFRKQFTVVQALESKGQAQLIEGACRPLSVVVR